MPIRWDPRKNDWLKRTRGVSFEEILSTTFVAIEVHPKRSNQNLLLFEINGYIWIVPYVTRGDELFLKMLHPSREYTKRWTRGEFK